MRHALLLLLPFSVSVPVEIPFCTNRLRVCRDGEDPFHGDDETGVQYCSENKLQRKTVYLTGASTWSSVYNIWIAQIILEEQMQVPVEIVNVNGGDTTFWKFDDMKLDTLDNRLYSWDALDSASDKSMDCSNGFKEQFMDVPMDLVDRCTENCKPCAHAMLEVWQHGQEENYRNYVIEKQTIEDGGALGPIGEYGWYTNADTVEMYPALASYRGFDDPGLTDIFKLPLPFGEYCVEFKDEWKSIVTSTNPSALDADIPAHFCHLFFQYAMLEEHDKGYLDGDLDYLPLRENIIADCASRQSQINVAAFGYYKLCTQYWITVSDLNRYLPLAGTNLMSKGYSNDGFLFQGYFKNTSGILQTSSCSSSLMNKTTSMIDDTLWDEDRLGPAGYNRFENYDSDIINSLNLSLTPFNMKSDVRNALELSGRLFSQSDSNWAPVLFNWHRPSSLFQRYAYSLSDKDWGGHQKEGFNLTKIHLNEERGCNQTSSLYEDRCNMETTSNSPRCGYQPQTIYKVFAAQLESYAPEAHYFLKRLAFSTEQQEAMMAAFDYDLIYQQETPPTRHRQVVCDWVKNNSDVWSAWLPKASNQIRCVGEIGNPLKQDNPTKDPTLIECSGHGKCMAEELPLHPNAGNCLCEQGWESDDCSGLVDPEELNVQYLDMPYLVISSFQIGTLMCLLFALRQLKIHETNSAVFQTSHPLFMRLNLYALIIAVIGISSWGGSPTFLHCMCRPLCIALSHGLVCLTMFVKLSRKMNRLAMNTEDIYKALWPFLGFYSLLFAMWFVFYTPKRVDVRLTDRVWLKYAMCDYSSNSAAFEGVLLTVSIVFLGYCAKTSYDLRLKATYFNEGMDLLKTSMAMAVAIVTAYSVSQLFHSPDEINKYMTVAISILVVVWIVMLLLIYPKYRVHFFTPERNNLKVGLYHPTGDPSLAIGDPVMSIKVNKFITSKKRTKKVTPVIAPKYRVTLTRPTLFSKEKYNSRRGPTIRRRGFVPGLLRNIHRRLTVQNTSAIPGKKQNMSATKHAENIEDLELIDNHKVFAPPEIEVTQKPTHNKSKRLIRHRSPEMYRSLEKKLQVIARENGELTKIIEEHRIDPVTGEMDEDFMDTLHRIRLEYKEVTSSIETKFRDMITDIVSKNEAEKALLIAERNATIEKIMNDDLAHIETLEMEKSEQREKLSFMENQVIKSENALRGILPPLPVFLEVHNLSEYFDALTTNGFSSTEKLILASESDLKLAGMKTGHMRRLRMIIEEMEAATPAIVLSDGTLRAALKTNHAQRIEESSVKKEVAWMVNHDPATKKRYLVHPHTGETKWDDTIRINENGNVVMNPHALTKTQEVFSDDEDFMKTPAVEKQKPQNSFKAKMPFSKTISKLK